jgi:hypothetical protein
VEDIVLDRDISITIRGGYDCGYSSVTGVTTIIGDMTISEGAVTMENFEIVE